MFHTFLPARSSLPQSLDVPTKGQSFHYGIKECCMAKLLPFQAACKSPCTWVESNACMCMPTHSGKLWSTPWPPDARPERSLRSVPNGQKKIRTVSLPPAWSAIEMRYGSSLTRPFCLCKSCRPQCCVRQTMHVS